MLIMINLLVAIIHVIVFIIGLIICGSRLQNNRIYKYGLWFFSFRIVITILDAFKSILLMPLLARNLGVNGNLALTFSLLGIPTLIMSIIAYVILIAGFIKAINPEIKG